MAPAPTLMFDIFQGIIDFFNMVVDTITMIFEFLVFMFSLLIDSFSYITAMCSFIPPFLLVVVLVLVAVCVLRHGDQRPEDEKMIGFNILKKVNDDCHCILILGRRRSGKSTLQAALAQQANNLGYKCFSNYPIANCFMIPKTRDRHGRIVLDKAFLYDNKALEHSFVLLDEISSIWPARNYSSWTEQDSDFFNFLGKNDIRLFLVCQYYDTIDLNIKRSLDATWFVKRTMFSNISKVECCYHDLVKVEDLTSHVLDSKYRKITFEAAELPDRNYYFFRKKWYPYFATTYKYEQQQKPYKLVPWSSTFTFGVEELQLRETSADDSTSLSAKS